MQKFYFYINQKQFEDHKIYIFAQEKNWLTGALLLDFILTHMDKSFMTHLANKEIQL